LDPPESTTQTASRSVQPFLHSSRQSVARACHFPKIASWHGAIWTNTWFLLAHPSPHPNGIWTGSAIFGRPFVKRCALCYRTVVCRSCLSCPVCDVGVLWPNRLTDQDETIGMQVGLGPGHIALDGDPAFPPSKEHSPPNFRPISVAAKWLQCCIDQDATGMEVGLGPCDFVLDGDPTPPPQKRTPATRVPCSNAAKT